MADRRLLSEDKQIALRAAFEQGICPSRAARGIGVTQACAYQYFKVFGWKRPQRQPKPKRKKPLMPGLPVYTGPDWIG